MIVTPPIRNIKALKAVRLYNIKNFNIRFIYMFLSEIHISQLAILKNTIQRYFVPSQCCAITNSPQSQNFFNMSKENISTFFFCIF